MGKHVSRTDYSAYGYVGSSIEKMDVDQLKEHLAYYVDRDPKGLNVHTRGKSLLDLALDNIDEALEKEDGSLGKALEVLETLTNCSKIDLNIIHSVVPGRGDGHSFISHLVNLIGKHQDNKRVKESLLAILTKVEERNGGDLGKVALTLLDSPNLVQNIEILRANGKAELVQQFRSAEVLNALIEKGRFADFVDLVKLLRIENFAGIQPDNLKALLGQYAKGGLQGLNQATIFNIFKDNLDISIDRLQISKKEARDVRLIHAAIRHGHIELVREIIKASPEMLERAYNGNVTPLKCAAIEGRHDIQELLIDNGARVTGFDIGIGGVRVNYLGNLIEDREQGIPIINKLIEAGKISDLLEPQYIQQIYRLGYQQPAIAGYAKIFDTLINQGLLAEFNDCVLLVQGPAVWQTKYTLHDFILDHLDVPKLNKLLADGQIDFSKLKPERQKALFKIYRDHYEKLGPNKQLLKAEILNYAIKHGKWKSLDKLITSKAVDPKDLDGNADTILRAYLSGELDNKISSQNLITLMSNSLGYQIPGDGTHLKGGIKSGGFTILHCAAFKGDYNVVQGLLAIIDKEKSIINVQTTQGQTAYAIAQQLKHHRITESLIAAGSKLATIVVEQGYAWGQYRTETNTLKAALDTGDDELALRIIQSDQFRKLGKDDTEMLAIYAKLSKKPALLREALKKTLLPLKIGSKNILHDLIQEPDLLGLVINHYDLDQIHTEQILGELLTMPTADLIKYNRRLFATISDGEKKAEFAKLLLERLINEKRFKEVTALQHADIVTLEAVMERMTQDNVLHELYTAGSAEILSARLEVATTEEINSIDPKTQYTLLHKACLNGQVQLAKRLIAKGADPFREHPATGMTPLMLLAVSERREQALAILKDLASNPDFSDGLRDRKDEYMHVLLALKNNNIELAQEFLNAMEPKLGEFKGEDRRFKEAREQFRKTQAAILSNIFLRAVLSGDADLMTKFFKLKSSKTFDPTHITLTVEKDGSTNTSHINALFVAVRENNIPMLKAILESGNENIDLTKTDFFSGYTLLHEAMVLGRSEAVKAILEASEKLHAATLNASVVIGNDRLTALNTAYNQKVILENQLLKEQDPEKRKALQLRIKGIYESMDVLLKYKGPDGQRIDINTSMTVELDDQDGQKRKYNILTDAYQDLMKERSSDHPDQEKINRLEQLIVNILHHPDVDLDITNEYGQDLLMLASIHGDVEVVVAVALNRQDGSPRVNKLDNLGNTALIGAAQSGHPVICRYLIEAGARTDGVNKEGTNALMAACHGGHLGVVELLAPDKESVRSVDLEGNTPLHYLVTNNSEERGDQTKIADYLLKLEADIDARNKDGRTPLMLAVLNNDVEMVRHLMQKGANVNIADKDGNTALLYACLLNNKDMIDELLKDSTLDVTHRNKDGVTAFLIAAARQQLEQLPAAKKEQMLQGVEGLQRDKVGKAMEVGANAYPGLAQVLINRGADPYESNPNPMLWNIVKTIGLATTLSVANNYLFNSLPVHKEIGKSLIAGYTGYQIYSTVSDKVSTVVTDFFNADTERDNRIDLEDTLMIGSFHDRGLGAVKHGASLHKDIEAHKSFKKHEKGIYTAKDFNDFSKTDKFTLPWQMRAHKVLTAKYVTVMTAIDSQPWYYTFPLIWKSRALKAVAQEILKTDQRLLDTNGANERRISVEGRLKTFEELFGGEKDSLIEILKSSKASKQLLKNMLEQPEDDKVKQIREIINAVVNGKIIVAPDTFLTFLKFSRQLKELEMSSKKRDAFLKATKKSLLPETLDYICKNDVGTCKKYIEAFIAKKDTYDIRAQSEEEQVVALRQAKKSMTERLLDSAEYYTGIKKGRIVDVTAHTASRIMGAAAGLGAAAVADDKVRALTVAAGAAIAAPGVIGSMAVGAAYVGIAGLAGTAAYKLLPMVCSVVSSGVGMLRGVFASKPVAEVPVEKMPASIQEARDDMQVKPANILGALRKGAFDAIGQAEQPEFDLSVSVPSVASVVHVVGSVGKMGGLALMHTSTSIPSSNTELTLDDSKAKRDLERRVIGQVDRSSEVERT